MTCRDRFPGEQGWTCAEDTGHTGAHRDGCVSWSSGGSQVADRHDATSGGEH